MLRGVAQRLLRRTPVSPAGARKQGLSTQGGGASPALALALALRCASLRSPHAPERAAGEEEAEKLGFVTALGARSTHACPALLARCLTCLAPCAGGLVAASAGAIAVFGLGVLGVMGAAKGAAMLLGALRERLRRPFLLSTASAARPGHSLEAKRPAAVTLASTEARARRQLVLLRVA